MKLLDRKCARETRSGYLRRKEVIADDSGIKENLHVTLNILLDPIYQHSVVRITSSDYLGHCLLNSLGQYMIDDINLMNKKSQSNFDRLY